MHWNKDGDSRIRELLPMVVLQLQSLVIAGVTNNVGSHCSSICLVRASKLVAGVCDTIVGLHRH